MSRTRVKICGLTRPEDVRLAAELGADAVGFNFYPKSPRYVDPRTVTPLLQALPPLLDAVGVFVDLKIRQVSALAYQLGLGSIQCFADANDMEDWHPFRLLSVFRVKDENHIREMERYLDRYKALGRLPSAILVDAHVDGQLGGTGQTAPWHLLRDFRPSVPLILAGGLTPDNVAEAIRTVRPYGVDVASGVESSPGQKDPDKMRRFMESVRSV
jgi:phosphoribosylanthranilate isomerase